MSNSIIACGQKTKIGCNVVRWDELHGLSFYSNRKYAGRNISLDKLRLQIKSCVIHGFDSYTAKQAHASLIAKSSSVNFIIDDDNYNGYATVYQCLDIKDAGLSHAPLNQNGPGILLCYHSDTRIAETYSVRNQEKYSVIPHAIVNDEIHGQKVKTFTPNQAQINSCAALLLGIVKLFPRVPPYFPRGLDGTFAKTVIADPQNYHGLLANFHIGMSRKNPRGFPFSQVEGKIEEESLSNDI